MNSFRTQATSLDRAYQFAFRLGYKLCRYWWTAFQPSTQGAFVGIWCQGQVLLIQNSYVPYSSFPGGGISSRETPAEAAIRECFEEVGLDVGMGSVALDFVTEHRWENKRDTVWMFRLELAEFPTIRIDNREVVEAAFYEPAEALKLPLFVPVRRHIQSRLIKT